MLYCVCACSLGVFIIFNKVKYMQKSSVSVSSVRSLFPVYCGRDRSKDFATNSFYSVLSTRTSTGIGEFSQYPDAPMEGGFLLFCGWNRCFQLNHKQMCVANVSAGCFLPPSGQGLFRDQFWARRIPSSLALSPRPCSPDGGM